MPNRGLERLPYQSIICRSCLFPSLPEALRSLAADLGVSGMTIPAGSAGKTPRSQRSGRHPLKEGLMNPAIPLEKA
jgi:hypothetical protein